MEVALFVLVVLVERARHDLRLRRWWAARRLAPALAVGGASSVPVPFALAGVDLRRLLLRPSAVVVAYVLYRYFSPPHPAGAYDGVNRLTGFALAFLGLAVLGVVASIGGRDRGSELVAATPKGQRAPVLSWVVLLTGVAVVEYGVLALLRYGRPEPAYGELLPDAWQLAQGPIMLLGGGLLGLLAARLMPAWVATPLAIVVGVGWVVTLGLGVDGAVMLAPMTEWVQWHEDGRVVVEPGSFGWHNAYLLGLCGLGVVALLLTVSDRRRVLLAIGAVLAAGTAFAGALALP